MGERARERLKRTFVALLVLLPTGGAMTLVAFEVSSQPRFCGSCHVMTPYYESWKHSTHHDIACVECHIPPGVRSTLRKKYEALAMVTSYFTGTYSTKPWAEIDDQSCLRSGCHAKRLLLGAELYREVLFDHQPHLGEMRRGKQLRCTSCHSQIVQGSHISVTPTTCFLCHFKDTTPNQGTARCTLCHPVPDKMIETAGLSFDHADVKRFGMDCMACHEGVVKGEGSVPRERCYSCHSDVSRLERHGEAELLHQVHVTDHKVECLHCHMEITHAVPAREETVATPCQACHSLGAGHSAVRDLYRGIGAKDVEPRPAAMYLAGIRCEACHTRPGDGHQRADAVSCMSCHGPKYLTIYRNWKEGLRHRLDTLEAGLHAVEALPPENGSADGTLLAEVRANLDLLRAGRPIHNPPYALAIMEKAHADMAALWEAAGREGSPASRWVEAPYQSACLGCHFGVELLSGNKLGTEFAHRPHVVAARLRCTICHGDMEAHGTLGLETADCDSCHEKIARPMADTEPDECQGCHPADIGRVSEKVRFPHEKHIEAGFDCETCHEGAANQPHAEFARSGDALPKFGHEFCATCHSDDVMAEDGSMPDGADCDSCHESY
jgi:nitrate/TMAO reductase-like tetraheme cytochrome c subunit